MLIVFELSNSVVSAVIMAAIDYQALYNWTNENTTLIYTGIVFGIGIVVTLLIVDALDAGVRKKRREKLQNYAYVTVSLMITAFVFGAIGYGVGYSNGYSDRVWDEDLRKQKNVTQSLLLRMFWSVLLAGGVGSVFFYQNKSSGSKQAAIMQQ